MTKKTFFNTMARKNISLEEVHLDLVLMNSLMLLGLSKLAQLIELLKDTLCLKMTEDS